MTRDEIDTAVLADNADTSHETAEDWYDAYGAHVSTAAAGDVCVQAVSYDWLDEDDDAVVARLRAEDSRLTRREAVAIVGQARSVREAADSICGTLDEAVAAYEAHDLDACRVALLAAYSKENDHGDVPATSALAGKLLVVCDDD